MSQTSTLPAIDSEYQSLLDSDRISERTRQIMEKRSQTSDADYVPLHLSPGAYAVLGALTHRVLPQETVLCDTPVNLAARLDARLGSSGDGWRFASLPPDIDAYEQALTGLDKYARQHYGAEFKELGAAQQDELIAAMAGKELLTDKLGAAQMCLWFADLRADCVQAFISHPAVQARFGIDAVFNGGDGFFQGFLAMGEGVSEDWEPTMQEAGR